MENVFIIFSSKKQKHKNQKIFAPYIHGKNIYCGFIVQDQNLRDVESFQKNFEMENVTFELLHFQVKL